MTLNDTIRHASVRKAARIGVKPVFRVAGLSINPNTVLSLGLGAI